MAKYLDSAGITALWSKIKSTFLTEGGGDSRYLKLSGGTLSGSLNTPSEKYRDSGSYGINLNNSDIIGVNGIFTQDPSESWKESLAFIRSDGTYDSIRANSGVLYFGVGNQTSEYVVIHSGNYASYCAPASHTHNNYLPLSGGAMTGNISYQGSMGTYEMIKFLNNTASYYGYGIALGGGGAAILGGGESSGYVISQLDSGGDERCVVSNDNNIEFYSNLQDGWDYRKTMIFDTSGDLNVERNINAAGATFTGSVAFTLATDAEVGDSAQPALCIGGTSSQQHIEIDGNEILSKNGTAGSDLSLQYGSGNLWLCANNGGNVGIGTQSASYKLHVNGSLNATTIYQNGTQVSVVGHTHSYLPLSGGTLTGVLNLLASQNSAYTTGTGALNLNNSDITGVNSILTEDYSNSWQESIGFKRSNGNYDTFRAADGTFYFGVNSGTSEYTAVHSGNIGSQTVSRANYTDCLRDPDYHSYGTSTRRPAGNIDFNYDGGLHYFLATSTMSDSGRPGADGYILHCSWDNGYWKSQMFIANGDASNARIKVRHYDPSTSSWGDWHKIYDDTNLPAYPTLSSLGAAPANHTHSYLPLSGGTLSGSDNILNITSSTSDSWIYFRNGSGSSNKASCGYYSNFAFIANEVGGYARIGVNDSGVPQYWSSNSSSTAQTLLHTGNYTSYCAPASHSHSYLPLSGGYLTGNIGYSGSQASYEMIKFINNTSNSWGNGIAIGGGGQCILGGGESTDVLIAQTTNDGSEVMWIGNDSDIEFYANLQSGWDYRKYFKFATDGNLYIGSNIGLHSGNYTSYTVSKTGSGASGTWGISVSGNAAGLENKALTVGSTLDSTAGTFTFTSSSIIVSGNDYVGLQCGSEVDKFQITADGNSLYFRQNDSGGTNTSWQSWRRFLNADEVSNLTNSEIDAIIV